LVQALAHPSLTKFGNIIASEAIAPVDTISFWPGPTEQKIMLFQWDKLEKKNRVGRLGSRCTHSSQKLRLWGGDVLVTVCKMVVYPLLVESSAQSDEPKRRNLEIQMQKQCRFRGDGRDHEITSIEESGSWTCVETILDLY
jgi:hypothetical protein